MSERSEPFMDDEEFERRLRGLAGAAHFPEPPDFVALFQRDIATPPVSISRRRPLGRFLLAAAILLLILGATLALIPGTRHAVADWFDIPGIRLFISDETPTAIPVPRDPPLAVRSGPAVSRESAAAAVDFPLMLPNHPAVTGTPEIYLTQDGAPVVLVTYPISDMLPEAAQSGEGLLLVEFRSSSDAVWGMKQAGATNEIRVVRVNGVEALWVGGTHQLMIVPAEPGATPVSRRSANVLAWNVNGITYRLEADLPVETMIAVAESLAPAS